MGIIEFGEYLASKGLSDCSMKFYLGYYKKFDKGLDDQDLTQEYLNKFLIRYNSNVSRAFVKNLFEHLDITHLKIYKLTGRKPKKKRKSLTGFEVKVMRKWLYHNKNIRYLLLFDLSYFCALRKSEALGIKVKDFELKEWAVDPIKSCKLLIHGKGRRERYVPVPFKIMKRVVDYIQSLDKQLEDRVFSFNKNRWQEVFKEAVRIATDYNYTLHDLRRSRATYWLKQGIDLTRVRNRLGHQSVATTQLYINLDEEKEFDRWAEE